MTKSKGQKMTFKFLVILSIKLAFIDSITCDFGQTQNSLSSTTSFQSQSEDLADFIGSTSYENSLATPVGYDYTPNQQIQQPTQQTFVQKPIQKQSQLHTAAAGKSRTRVPAAAKQISSVPAKQRLVPSASQHFAAEPVQFYGPAKYDFSYGVHDVTTGDIKMHAESRDGDYVQGYYTVVDPDGFKRTVTYTANESNGFQAVVNREPYADFRPFLKSNSGIRHVNQASQSLDSYSAPPSQQGVNGVYA